MVRVFWVIEVVYSVGIFRFTMCWRGIWDIRVKRGIGKGGGCYERVLQKLRLFLLFVVLTLAEKCVPSLHVKVVVFEVIVIMALRFLERTRPR